MESANAKRQKLDFDLTQIDSSDHSTHNDVLQNQLSVNEADSEVNEKIEDEGNESLDFDSDIEITGFEPGNTNERTLCGEALWRENYAASANILKLQHSGYSPQALYQKMTGAEIGNVPDKLVWAAIFEMMKAPSPRCRLRQYNTLNDCLHLLRNAQNIMVLTGAGISVSCGIPDFRSANGIYAKIKAQYPELQTPEDMFDIHHFRKDPRCFYTFAKELWPGQFNPSPTHRFIRALELRNKLLRNYSQNIDALENAAGVSADKLVQCHGSFASATCTVCERRVEANVMRDDIMDGRVPWCGCDNDTEAAATSSTSSIPSRGVLKPNIVFFGEGLPDTFHESMAKDKAKVDLFLLIGSSLKVRPVAFIPYELPPSVPQILINRERLRHHSLDVELLGDCDLIIDELCRRLGWRLPQDATENSLCDEEEEKKEEIEVDKLMVEVKADDLLPSIEELEKKEKEDKENRMLAAAAAAAAKADAEEKKEETVNHNVDGENTKDELSEHVDKNNDDDDDVAILEDSEIDDAHLVPKSLRQRFLCKLADRLSDHHFAHVEPNKYVFRGCTEIYDNLLSGDSDSEEEECDDEEEEDDEDDEYDGLGTSGQPLTISDDEVDDAEVVEKETDA